MAGRRRTVIQIEKQVQEVLLELMRDSGSDAVRVAAAKALIDKLRKQEETVKNGDAPGEERRGAVLAEARGILEQLAYGVSGSFSGAAALDEMRAARTDCS